jgi:hypothetical protein
MGNPKIVHEYIASKLNSRSPLIQILNSIDLIKECNEANVLSLLPVASTQMDSLSNDGLVSEEKKSPHRPPFQSKWPNHVNISHHYPPS